MLNLFLPKAKLRHKWTKWNSCLAFAQTSYLSFFPQTYFWAQFFSTQKRINRGKTDPKKKYLPPKRHKLRRNPHSCGEIWFLHICHVEEFLRIITKNQMRVALEWRGKSESGQMVLKKMKLTYFDAYICQTMWNHAKKIDKELKRQNALFL